MTALDIYLGLQEHVTSFWSNRPRDIFTWDAGPIGQAFPLFRVFRFAPSTSSESWVYVTVGAWEANRGDPALEFVLLSPKETPRHVETLAMLTYFHADTRYGPLRIGRTVDIGRPWLDDSPYDHLLVTLPYPFGPALEWCALEDRSIRFLWVVPINRSEARFIGSHGLEAFEDLIERSCVDVLDPNRPCVVSD